MRPRGRSRERLPFSLFRYSFRSVSRGDSTGISVNEAVDRSVYYIPGGPEIERARRSNSKRESLNDRRIEKTLYDRVNKRPSGPKRREGKSAEEEEEEDEETDVGVGGGALICKAEHFFARFTHLCLVCSTELVVHLGIITIRIP